ncbi:hypothetical protein Thermus77412_06900 [Thermus antranikianii]|mgnify:CR=1 FL=1
MQEHGGQGPGEKGPFRMGAVEGIDHKGSHQGSGGSTLQKHHGSGLHVRYRQALRGLEGKADAVRG